MFCEGLAARIALEVCEPLTQSTAKLGAIAKVYQEWIDQARTVNAIEQGVDPHQAAGVAQSMISDMVSNPRAIELQQGMKFGSLMAFEQAVARKRAGFPESSRLAKDADAFGESPWSDVAGYGIIGMIMSGKLPPATEPEPNEAVSDLSERYNHLRHVVWSVLSELKHAKSVDQVFAEDHMRVLRRHDVSPDQRDPLQCPPLGGQRFA